MSSRVEQENQARQAEAERLQKRVEREGRDAKTNDASREAFGRLVKSNQGERQARAQGDEHRASTRRGEEKGSEHARKADEGDRAARMARGGVVQQGKLMEQARSFQGVMQSQQATTHEADKGRVERRDQGKQKDRVERDDRETAITRAEHKRDVEAEEARIEARAQAAPHAAIRGDADRGGGGDGRGDDPSAAIARQKQAASAAADVKAPREVKQIPPELLEKLVSAVWLGVSQKGLKEFHIELKDGPLKGAFLKISAEGGRVGLRFEGLGADERRLVEASKGELMRRLEKKGLALARLEVG